MRPGKTTYLAVVVEIKLRVTQEVPDAILDFLSEYEDVMHPDLPKELPPRMTMDHKIELVSGSNPSVQAPYPMPPTELEELRKHLDLLLCTGLVQPSKAPYGSPVLFQKKQNDSFRF